jgi:hypothetical protein
MITITDDSDTGEDLVKVAPNEILLVLESTNIPKSLKTMVNHTSIANTYSKMERIVLIKYNPRMGKPQELLII